MQGEIEDKLASRQKAVAVYVSLLLLSFGWLALIVAAPVLKAQGHQLSSFVVYRSFSAVCHQLPERSFHFHGLPLGVCSRCTGIYVGFVIGLIIYPFVRGLRQSVLPERRWLILAALPALIDFGAGFIGLFTNTFFSRVATGGLLGAVAAFYILPGCVSTFRDFSTEIFLWRKLTTKSRL